MLIATPRSVRGSTRRSLVVGGSLACLLLQPGCCTYRLWEQGLDSAAPPTYVAERLRVFADLEAEGLWVVVEHDDGVTRATRWTEKPGLTQPAWSVGPPPRAGEPQDDLYVAESSAPDGRAREHPGFLFASGEQLAIQSNESLRQLDLRYRPQVPLRQTLRVSALIMLTPLTFAGDVVLLPLYLGCVILLLLPFWGAPL